MLNVFCLFAYTIVIQAQTAITTTGVNATGIGGSASYTIGQITYQTIEGTAGTVAQGVQQPYEISVVTAIENTNGITLEYKVYPNPTTGLLKLKIQPFDDENMKFRLYDFKGVLLQDKKIESEEIEISLENLSSSMYFLKVIKDNIEVKIFKIIRK